MNTTDMQLYFENKQVPAFAIKPLLKWLSLNEETFAYALRNVYAASTLVGKPAAGSQISSTAPEAFINTGHIVIRFTSRNSLPLILDVKTVLIITGIRITPNSITTEGNVTASFQLASEYAEKKVFSKVGWVNPVPMLA